MAAELQPPENPIPPPPPPASSGTTGPPPFSDNPTLPLAPKRQRRPSVRLGEIGDQPATLRATKNPWPHHRIVSSKHSRTRPMTNLVNGHEFHDEKRVKSRRGFAAKRVRSNWVSKSNDGDNCENEFRDIDIDSDSPVRDTSDDGVELDNYPESRERRDGNCDRVRKFLMDLGLSRYMPVFEIHEVDDEVLPLLTLEDLKDMGINAVGSRRKMYSYIQKLRRSC